MLFRKLMIVGLFLVPNILCGVAFAESSRQFSGVAAYYSTNYSGRTACGDRYDPTKFTAAHRSLPFGTRLRITDPRSQRTVVVVVNDRGPFTKGRVLDLSLAAAKALRMMGSGPREGDRGHRITGGIYSTAQTSPRLFQIYSLFDSLGFSRNPQGHLYARKAPGATPRTG